MTIRRAVRLVTVVVGLLVIGPANAECDPSPPGESHRVVAFTPDRPERCDYFFVTEFNTTITSMKSQDAVDRFILTDALGVMRNIDRSRAVGASLDMHVAGGEFRFAPTIRYKQWLSGRRSLDVALGYVTDSIEREGVFGPIVEVGYSPAPWFHVQAGVCRMRNVGSIFYYPVYRVNEDNRVAFHVGAGLGGVPGVASWGLQAIALGTLAAWASGFE